MTKEFRTYAELIDLMEARGIIVDDQTMAALKRDSYYAIVNGYKGPFLDREAMQSSNEDVYLPGTTFKEIYDLFLFDRDVRALLFPYLAKAESVMKNALVYAFCERNPDSSAYLERSSYVDAKNMLVPKAFAGKKEEEHGKNMATLMRILNSKLTVNARTRPFVRHYMEAYGTVPLWVLQNDLTFGNIEHFYQLQKRGVQNGACKIIAEVADRGHRITPHELLRAFNVLVGFRNMCAHDERIYCAQVKGARFKDMFRQLELILPEEETRTLGSGLLLLTQAYLQLVNVGALKAVLEEMNMIDGSSDKPVKEADDLLEGEGEGAEGAHCTETVEDLCADDLVAAKNLLD